MMVVTVPSQSRLPAECAVCRLPLHPQTAHALCPPCQARHNAAICRQTSQSRSNLYPVVTPFPKPIARALGLNLAFAYPNAPLVPPATDGGKIHHREGPPRVCMRFGCGARLPANAPGEMCAACAGAGFARPRPTSIPKRIPRRATERADDRPRESLELVRASLRRAEANPIVRPRSPCRSKDTPTIPLCSNAQQSIPTADEDLELVYPEDVVPKATRPPSPKPRIRSSRPSTLRDLFKDSLRTVPLLLPDTPPTDKSIQRHCRTPGCNDLLPPQTCMQRCVKCTVADWKQRNLDVLDPARRSSTSSLTTTSIEEKEVAAMLDDTEMSDIDDECALSPPSSSPSKDSSGEPISNHIPGWDSDLTDLSDLETDDVSDTSSETDSTPPRLRGDTTSLRIRIPLLATRLPPGSLLRKCGNKRCNIALPKHHRWKTCDPCRGAQRAYQRMRCENIRRRILGLEETTLPDTACRRWRSLSPEMRDMEETLTPETSRPCAVRHCSTRIPLVEIYRWKTCVGCRARARREARRKQDVRIESELVPHFSVYQNRGSLLASFDAQLRGFIEGQLWYLRTKLREEESPRESTSRRSEHPPMQFMFVGEYAIVTGQRGSDGEGKRQSPNRDHDSAADMDAMRQEVSSIVAGLERVLRSRFKTDEAFVIESGGILSRFTCSLELIAQLHPLATPVCPDSGPGPNSFARVHASDDQNRDKDEDPDGNGNTEDGNGPQPRRPPPPPPNGQQPAVPLVKTLSGELETVIVPDDSHSLFYGRRTVIRYRMVG